MNDLDEFNVGAIGDANAAANSVVENAANGSVVGLTAFATDNDATTNTITYTLDDDAGGRFTIDANSGVVTILDGSLLDYDTTPSHNITIRASSVDGSSSTQVFTINLTNANEAPTAVQDTATAVEAGGLANGTSGSNPSGNVLTNDTDPDSGDTKTVVGVAIGVVGSASTNVGSNVSGTYGAIIIAADGSYSYTVDNSNTAVQALRTSGQSLQDVFTYTLQDAGGLQSTTQITVTITGANDTPHDLTSAALAVNENAANTTTIGTIAAHDVDSSANGETASFSLTDNAGGRFAIAASTGIITVADGSLLNREANASHTITVRVTDASGATFDKNFLIAVNDIDEYDVSTPTDTDASTNSVDENVAIGTTVGITANAFDLDATTNSVTYSLTSNPDGLFAIDTNTGVVTTAAAINREVAGGSRWITVRATSTDGSTSDQTFNITVNDLDEFNVGAIGDANAAANSVVENAANGSVVGLTALATDNDATTNSITYTLDDDAGGRFTIDVNSGVVTVLDGSLLDYDTTPSHNITIRASSVDGSSSTQVFTINLTNANEGPTAVSDSTNALEAGGLANGTSGSNPSGNVLTNDTDPDSGDTKTVVGVATGVVGSALTNVGSNVSGTYGAIIIAADGSYTYTVDNSNTAVQALRTSGQSLQDVFTYTLQDAGGLQSTTQITVTITGANDTPHDLTSAALAVNENAANTTTIGTIAAHDVDSSANGETASFSLTDNAGGRFAIDASTGIITVADGSLLNREANASHTITVRVTDASGATFDKNFLIAVNDIDEYDVSIPTDTDASTNSVDENVAIGTTVGITANAFDLDATTNSVTYSLTSNPDGLFAIDTNTGVVTTAAAINREVVGGSRSITVRATSADGSTADQTFNITVNDLDEFNVGAIGDANAAANSVVENAANGSVVGLTAFATDNDATTNTITYTLDDDAGGRFTIDANSGVVTVLDGSLLDYDTTPSHNVTIRASSVDGSSSTQVFTINLTDANEAPTAVQDTATAVEAGGLANGTLGSNPSGNVLSNDTDADSGDTKTVSGVVAGTAGSAVGSVGLGVNGSYGSITIAADGSYTYTIDNSHAAVQALRTSGQSLQDVFTYTIQDAGGLQATTQITVTITGANDTPYDVTATGLTVAENALNGTLVGMAIGADWDAGTVLVYTLTDDAGGRFTIDANTGEIRVADSSQLNYESSSSHNLTVRAIDEGGLLTERTFTVSVSNVNEKPTAHSASFVTNNVTPLIVSSASLRAGFADPESDMLTATVVQAPAQGSVSMSADGSFIFTPEAGFTGIASFTYIVSDGQLSSSAATIVIQVVLPPVSDDGSSGSGSSSTSDGTSTASNSSSNPSSSTQSSTNDSATETTQAVGGEENLQSNQVNPEASAQATIQHAQEGVAAQLESSQSQLEVLPATMLTSGITWNPITISVYAGRDYISQELERHVLRHDVSGTLTAIDRSVASEQERLNSSLSFAEPAKWTIISTGIVIWAIRLGHIITTFASTASAWIQFDPITLMQGVNRVDEDDQATSIFETRKKHPRT